MTDAIKTLTDYLNTVALNGTDALRVALPTAFTALQELEQKHTALSLECSNLHIETADLAMLADQYRAERDFAKKAMERLQDERDALRDELEKVQGNHDRLKKMVDDGSVNGRMYSAYIEQERQIVALEKELAALRGQEPVMWADQKSKHMWKANDEGGHPYHIICKGKQVRSHSVPLYLAAGAKA